MAGGGGTSEAARSPRGAWEVLREACLLEARVKGGTLCVFPSNIELPKEKKTQDFERYDRLVSDTLGTREVAVVSDSDDLFAAESDDKGDILLGAVMAPTAINICSSVNGFKGTIDIKVEWQFYDRGSAKVVETLTKHPDFNWRNPNRFRAVLGAFAAHHAGFHHASGAGYRLLADWLIQLAPVNPQTTARMCSAFQTWKRYDADRQDMIKAELDRILSQPGLSRDTTEMLTRIRGA